MALIALATAGRVEVVESIEQMTLPAAEAITAGMGVRVVPASTGAGQFTLGNGTDATEANIYGIATKSAAAGEPVTALRQGTLDGYTFAAGDEYGDPIYLSDTDGRLGDTAGTVSLVVGRVAPGTAVTLGTAYDNLLRLTLA
jgi:hypothetical protein